MENEEERFLFNFDPRLIHYHTAKFNKEPSAPTSQRGEGTKTFLPGIHSGKFCAYSIPCIITLAPVRTLGIISSPTASGNNSLGCRLY